jgi:hypothetical protein
MKPELRVAAKPPVVGQGRQPTPVFSSANPPRGVSGLIRRLAYRSPDYRPQRWLLLVLADRVDVAREQSFSATASGGRRRPPTPRGIYGLRSYVLLAERRRRWRKFAAVNFVSVVAWCYGDESPLWQPGGASIG